MSRNTFSPSIKDKVIQAFVGSGASSKSEFYNTILPEVWTQEGFNKPIPALNTIYRWLKDCQESNHPESPARASDVSSMGEENNVLSVTTLQDSKAGSSTGPRVRVLGIPKKEHTLGSQVSITSTVSNVTPSAKTKINHGNSINNAVPLKLGIPNPQVEQLGILTPLVFFLAANLSVVRLLLIWIGLSQQAISSRLIKLAKWL